MSRMTFVPHELPLGFKLATLPLPIALRNMTVATMNQVQAAMHSQRFRAFTVHLKDGSSDQIKHPDFISWGRSPDTRVRQRTVDQHKTTGESWLLP